MSVQQQNKDITRRFYHDVFDKGDMGALERVLAPDIVEHESTPGGHPPTREGIKANIQELRAAFPDIRAEVQEELADGDRVIARVRLTGTHEGPLMDLKPTGRKVSFETIDIIRFRNGKAVEHWGVTDNAGLLMQLGALPGPATASRSPR